MTNEEIAELFEKRIDSAIKENVKRELLITGILVLEVLIGASLLVYGVKQGGIIPFVAGATCEAAIGWPIAKLLSIRRDNLYLKILPGALRLADTKARKELVYKFIEKLMANL